MRPLQMLIRRPDRDPPPPPVTWHKVRLIEGGRSFLYRDSTGTLRHAGPRDVVTIDGDTLNTRRRDVELL